ncbi:MAG: helix-turn-helix transcriptional regulator [Lachnospiraceae bacterium]|nr:helix-turn-helix transcriptional regulator [Lachnospiraceae bacterium]
MNRIKTLRKELNMTQQEFADKIGSKRNTIAKYETDVNVPSTAVISLICREFNVNENWLRNGNGDIFIEKSHDAQIEEFIDCVLKTESSNFKRRLISALSRMDEKGWDALEKLLLSIQSETEYTQKPIDEMTIDERVEDYRYQLELEQKAGERSKALQKSG